MKQSNIKTIKPSFIQESTRKELLKRFIKTPIPPEFILENLELYMRPQRISEILSLNCLYMKILKTQGIIIEFGVRWGRHLSVFSALRAIYEPYNFYRKIVGFDTFTGFTEPSEKDGSSDKIFKGSMAVSHRYEEYLETILSLHEAEAPLSHLKRTELRKGNAPEELKKYLSENPETLIALAYFDMDIYEPTRECLQIIQPYLVKGSLLAFDELMHPEFPGETIALKEIIDITQKKVERFTTAPYPCYIIM